jgi:Glycosyl hydrolase family 26
VVLGGAYDGAADGAPATAAPPSVAAPAADSFPVPSGPPAVPGDGRIYIGSVAGGYEQALAGTGVPLANHAYAFFTSKVPQAAMITVSAGGTKWRDVAAAAPGSALYGQIVAWAQTVKARGQTVMLAYNHEPEAHDRLTLGGAAEFIAAWRNVRTIFDRQGATNVIWTWQMTAYSFRVDPSSEQHAAKWYPGDAWVDNVGADAYNWIDCGATGTGQYNELQFLGDPVIAFARAHGKKASFPAFASHANADRAQWLANAHRYLVANEDILTAAFYFNHPPTIAANAECRWGLTSAAEYGRLREMAGHRALRRLTAHSPRRAPLPGSVQLTVLASGPWSEERGRSHAR